MDKEIRWYGEEDPLASLVEAVKIEAERRRNENIPIPDRIINPAKAKIILRDRETLRRSLPDSIKIRSKINERYGIGVLKFRARRSVEIDPEIFADIMEFSGGVPDVMSYLNGSIEVSFTYHVMDDLANGGVEDA